MNLPALRSAQPLTEEETERAWAAIELVAYGWTVAEIGKRKGLPTKDEFFSYLMREPSLALAYTKARELSAYAFEDEALELTRLALVDPEAPPSQNRMAAIRTRLEMLRWSAEKRNPTSFSAKTAANVVVPVQINTSLDLGTGAQGAGTADFPNIYELKAETVREVEVVEEGEARPKPKLPKLPKVRTRKRVLIPKGEPDAVAEAVKGLRREQRKEQVRKYTREWKAAQ